MRGWNTEDATLLPALRGTRFVHLSFVEGLEGDVGVYRGSCFLGAWVEFNRSRYSFVPAAYLQPTIIDCDIAGSIEATRNNFDTAPSHLASVPNKTA